MNFMRYIARRLVGLPPSSYSLEVVEAMNHIPLASPIASPILFSKFPCDFAARELDYKTYGAISPTLRHEDCLSSAELEEAAGKIYRSL